MKFSVGDRVLRIGTSFDEVRHGEEYVVSYVVPNTTERDFNFIKLVGLSAVGEYDGRLFKLVSKVFKGIPSSTNFREYLKNVANEAAK